MNIIVTVYSKKNAMKQTKKKYTYRCIGKNPKSTYITTIIIIIIIIITHTKEANK
jgi:hypothetical protein